MSTEVQIYSFHIQVGSVAAHKEHTFRSAKTNTQLTLAKALCIPAYSPSVIPLQRINQKASFSLLVEGGMNLKCLVVKSRPTPSFLPPSHLWLGLKRLLFSCVIEKKRMTSLPCCTLRDKDRTTWFPQYPL